MAIYSTDVYTGRRSIEAPTGVNIQKSPIDVDFPTVALAAGDVVKLVTVPAGVTLQDYELHFPDIDSNGTPALAFSFGVLNAAGTDLATVYASGLTAGQSSAIVRNPNTDAAQADNSVERRLALKVTAAAGTYAGAGKRGTVLVHLRG